LKTIQPFIDLGLYTVPLTGKLERLNNGDKTTPIFEKDWRNKYQSKFNEKATAIGGAITGAISNIIAIDCDDQKTYDLFRGLDRENTFNFISKGKPSGGGTIIYKYPTGTSLGNFKIQSDLLKLDFYADNGFVYLPTGANLTKEAWGYESFGELPTIQQLPATVETLLLNLQHQCTLKSKPEVTPKVQVRSNYLAPQVEMFVAQKKFIPALFRIITPKDFRDLDRYVKYGYLHPDDVPDGRGSEYMMKVSAILGADPSVNTELYQQAMHVLNTIWASPIPNTKFISTIVNPMVNGNSSINGEPIWQYDEHWKTRGLTFTTKLGDASEVFFDDVRACYYMINYTKDMVKIFSRDSDLFAYIEPVAIALPDRKGIKTMVPVVRTGIEPSLQFGFYKEDEYTRRFNLFKQTPALAILNDPSIYKKLYSKPETIIQFFETFIPDIYMRNYVLRFIKRKMTSFKYSPVILYFLGAHGSGKDTFVQILESILGAQYLARPTTKEFLEQYNGWLVDKYFVQLDEYGNQLQSMHDKQIALGKIKAYTGKAQVQIRQMRTDGFNYMHMATFMLTANNNPLLLEEGDRRVALIDTPNVLKDAAWIVKAGGISAVIEQLYKEINDFCYYLATEVDELPMDEYMTPPDTQAKKDIICDKLPAAQRLVYCFNHGMFEQIEDLIEEAGSANILADTRDGRIFEDDLFDLYTYMTEGRGTKRGLTKIFKEAGYGKAPTTKGGIKQYYYRIPALMHYQPTTPFEDVTKDVDIAGL